MSFLTRHITNPVYLRELRRGQRSPIGKILLGLFLIFSFVIPLLVFLFNPADMREEPGQYTLMLTMLTAFWFSLFWPFIIGRGLKDSSPQQEFLRHGKLQPQTLISGIRKSLWTGLGFILLALLPGTVLALLIGSDAESHYLMGRVVATYLTVIILSLFLIELSLSTLGLGYWSLFLVFLGIFYFPVIHLIGLGGEDFFRFVDHLFFETRRKELESFDTAALPWSIFAGGLILAITITACVIAANAMMLQPRASNRECRFRITLTAACIISMSWMGYCTWSYAGSGIGMALGDMMMGGMLGFSWCLSLSGMLAGWGEPAGPLPLRLRREIPAGKLRRWLAYPFFSGPDPRIVWSAGLVVAAAIAYAIFNYAMTAKGISHGEHYRPPDLFCATFMLVACYLQVAVLLQDNPNATAEELKHKVGKFALICVIGLGLAFLILASVDKFAPSLNLVGIVFSLPVGIALFLIQTWRSHRWFAKRWREFRPAEEGEESPRKSHAVSATDKALPKEETDPTSAQPATDIGVETAKEKDTASWLAKYITNPVCLMEMRRSYRSSIGLILVLGALFFSLILPAGVYLADYASAVPEPTAMEEAGDPEEFRRFNSANFNSFGGDKALVIVFSTQVVLGAIVAAMVMGLGIVSHRAPQREFIHHGKLQPKTLLSGVRKTAWALLALGQLATLPGMIFVCYLGSGESYNYPVATLTIQLISILIGLALIETGLCCVTGGFAALFCYFFCLLGVLLIHWALWAGSGYITHINHLLLGGELPNENWNSHLNPHGDHPVVLADLPWALITFMLFFAITSMTCGILANHMALQPGRSNREARFRLALTVSYVLLTGWFGYMFYKTNHWDLNGDGKPWEYMTIGACLSLLGMAGGFGAHFGSLPQRVREQIPKDKWRRWLAYPFFSGPDSRLLWFAGLLMVNTIIFGIATGFSDWKVTFGSTFLIVALCLYNTDLIRKNEGLERDKLLAKCALGNLIYVVFPICCIGIICDKLEFLNSRVFEEVICFPLGVTLLLVLAWRHRKWFIKRSSDFKPAQ